MSDAVLTVEDLTLRFGGLTAVNRVSLRVASGEVLAVIGPNGAGKTSLFNAITGVYRPTSGKVLVDGREMVAPLRRRHLAAWILGSLACGLAAAVAVNLDALWRSAIIDLYQPPRAFPWGQALTSLINGLRPQSWTVVPFLAGSIIAALVGWRLWLGSRWGAERVARSGIARTFQNIRLFRNLSCRDNVLVGMHPHLHSRWFDAILRLPRHLQDERDGTAAADELLDFVGLSGVAGRFAGTLPYGHQRRLEIARALALRPTLLLLDEPAAGMNPSESQELMALIRRIRERGVTCLLIEHDMAVVMGVSDRIAVLHYGSLIAEGSPAEIRANPAVIEAYLGKDTPT